MVDRDDALQALGVIRNATLIRQTPQTGSGALRDDLAGAAVSNVIHRAAEFFAPEFDYDFTNLTDKETYRRGREVYERPCGWHRFGIKVLDKYEDNVWLGTPGHRTRSVPGEWPVSYHGTSKEGADGIVKEHYKVGPGAVYGPGIYSSPSIDVVVNDGYAEEFTSEKTGRKLKVVLQNRINKEYRQKHNNDEYWLVKIPEGLTDEKERAMVERAIRPYGLLLKEV